MKKLLILLAVLCSGVLWVQAETITDEITFSALGSPNSYTTAGSYESSTTGVKYSSFSIMSSSGNMQIKKNTIFLSVASNPKSAILTKVQITYTTDTKRDIILYTYNQGYTITSETTAALSDATEAATLTSSSTSYSFAANTTNYYFQLKNSNKGAAYLSKIEVTWDVPTDNLADSGLAVPTDVQTINIGETLTNPLTNTNNITDIAYTSSNPAIASVDENGDVKGLAKGTATITAKFEGNETYKSFEKSYSVKVVDPNAPEATFDFAHPSTLDPAKEVGNTVSGVTFSSECVTFVATKGSSTDAKFYSGSLRVYGGATVTISIPDTEQNARISSIAFTYDTDKSISLASNQPGTFSSDKSSWTGVAKSVQFSISAVTKFATVIVTVVKQQSATLSFSQDEYEVVVGNTLDSATPSAIPEDATSEVTYSSDNEEVATVDSNGVVTAKAVGTATITASISDNAKYSDASASYTLTVKPVLGEIVAKTSAGVAFKDNDEVAIYDGTSLSFSAENAEKIVMYDESGDEEILIKSVDGNSCEWTPSQTDLQMITVVATCGNTQKQELSFYLTVNEPLVGLGEIIGVTPDNTAIESDEEITITEGEKLVFSAENATKIEVFDYTESTKLAESEGSKLEWTPGITEAQIVQVIASLENNTKELAFYLTVNALEVGDIVAKCDGEVFSGKTFTCEVGSTLTFSADNALHITVQSDEIDDDDFKVLAKADSNEVSYQCNGTVTNQEIYVTAYRYTDSSENKSTFGFKLTVIPTLERRTVWTLVTSADELVAGQEYLICAASSNQAISTTQNSNNRKATDVTITDNTISAISDDVQVITLSESTSVAGAFNLGVGLDANGNQQYLYAAGNANASSKDNKLGTKTDVSDLTAATITMGEAVSIEYTKATGNTGKYMYYNTNKNGSTSNPIFSCYVATQSDSKYELLRLFKKQTIAVPTTPSYNETTSSDNKKQLTFVSNVGDLYTIETEYDSNGKEVTSSASEVRSLVARKSADDTWKYAAAQGETYTVAAPTTTGNYITVQAKSVYNNVSSDVTTVSLSIDGTVSGIEGVGADSQDAPVEYYNLQGVRVSNPGTGLYIRRQGTKVEKVAIR
jgi:tellurite resistance protein